MAMKKKLMKAARKPARGNLRLKDVVRSAKKVRRDIKTRITKALKKKSR
jgi:hypothetical protein